MKIMTMNYTLKRKSNNNRSLPGRLG